MSHILPTRLQTGAPMTNIQSKLRTAPEFCKNVSLQCCLVATVIHIQSVRSQVFVNIHVMHIIETLFGQFEKKLRQQSMPLAISSSALA
jgi:hypothetical protein